jgi:hypothetical protein
MRLSLSVLGAAFVGALLSLPAQAGTGRASFALVPQHYDPALAATQSYFVIAAHPGETVTNSVRVRNVGTQTGSALLYAVDATTGQTSGAVYLDGTKPRRAVGSWVTLGARSVTLAPGQSRVVPVTVRVPAAAQPGDHLGGIVAENAALTGGGSGALRIKVRHLTIAAVLVQVPGPAKAAVAPTAARAGGEHGYQYVYLHLKSAGAVIAKPTGRLTVIDSGGKTVASRRFTLDTFVAGTAVDYPVLLPHIALDPGDYRAKIDLSYGAAAVGYRTTPGPMQTITRILPFSVTSGQYTQVFKGVAPAKAVAKPTASSGTSPLIWILAGAGALAVAAVAFVAIRLRRTP